MSNGAATILGIAIIIAAVLHGLLGIYQIAATETDAGAAAFPHGPPDGRGHGYHASTHTCACEMRIPHPAPGRGSRLPRGRFAIRHRLVGRQIFVSCGARVISYWFYFTAEVPILPAGSTQM
jgi:hypothetical protein